MDVTPTDAADLTYDEQVVQFVLNGTAIRLQHVDDVREVLRRLAARGDTTMAEAGRLVGLSARQTQRYCRQFGIVWPRNVTVKAHWSYEYTRKKSKKNNTACADAAGRALGVRVGDVVMIRRTEGAHRTYVAPVLYVDTDTITVTVWTRLDKPRYITVPYCRLLSIVTRGSGSYCEHKWERSARHDA